MEKYFVKGFRYIFASTLLDALRYLGKGAQRFHYSCGCKWDNLHVNFIGAFFFFKTDFLPVNKKRIPQHSAKPGKHLKAW